MAQIGSTAARTAQRPRLRDVALPGWRRWVPQAAIAWALGYGALRVYWALGDAPSPSPVGSDLLVVTGWWSVALCGATAVLVLALRSAPESRPLAFAGWCVTAALVVASAALLLGMTAYFGLTLVTIAVETVTGTWEQGSGSEPLWFFWVAVPAYLVWGLGLAAAALAYRRTTRPPCRTCSTRT